MSERHDYRKALEELGLELLEHPVAGTYSGLKIAGNTIYVSGHVGWRDGHASVVGRLGDDLGVEDGQRAARDAALAALGTLERELGDLSSIRSVARMFGMVRATSSFGEHPKVINGASQILLDVLGPEVGEHSRSAVGMASLPFGAAVEIEMTVIVDG